MQQPQSRPLLGDSVSSTTSPTTRRNNPVAVLTHQQLQQLQQLQAHNSTGQPLTFTLQQPSNNSQDQSNGAPGNHIVYLNQLNQLNQSSINHSGTGMGLPPATPTFGVGLNMGLPLSLLNTSLTSLTSNAITTSNPLLNLGLPALNPSLTTINHSLNPLNSNLNSINSNLNSNLPSNSINTGLSGLSQDLSGVNSGITNLNTLNASSINSGLSGINAGLTSVNPSLSSLNSTINQNSGALNANLSGTNSGVSSLNTLNPNLSTNLTTTNINSGLNQGLNQTLNALTTGLTPSSINSSSANFPFHTIQSIQTIAPHIVGSNITHIPSSGVSQLPNSSISSISQISGSGVASNSSIFTNASNGPTLSAVTNANHASNVTHVTKIAHLGTMHSSMSNVQHMPGSNDPNSTPNHISSLSSPHAAGFQSQRQFSQGLNSNLSSTTLTGVNPSSNTINSLNTVKNIQNIQNQNISSPGSPFSIPLKSPASNIAPPTPSPSPNRLLLRSPAANSVQSSRNSPSPVTSASNTQFSTQLQSPMQSPMSVGQIQSPAPSPYPPAKSPHHLGSGSTLNNRSPAPGGSPGPPVVRPNTPILQQGMQVLQIIHSTPQGYQSTPTQLVTRTHLIGNQQIQIATAKPAKQPPQILPKPPNQQPGGTQQKQQRVTTTITSQMSQQTQPQLVLAGPQQSPTTATMIPTAQGLLLNQVLPSTGPVIVQQQPGGVQLILRTPANAQQQTHTAQLTQQQLVRVVTAQGMQLQGLAPAFFAVPNGFPPPAPPVIRHTPSSPVPSNSGPGNPIVIQNAMVQSPQPQLAQAGTTNSTGSVANTHTVVDQSLLPPPKKKAKKKKKTKKKDEEPPKLDLASIMKISGIGDDDDIFDNDLTAESDMSQIQVEQSLGQLSPQVSMPNVSSAQNSIHVSTANTQMSGSQCQNSQLVAQLQMPVQNTISGHLRLAVGEDGRVVLHHTPEPNQPEIDQNTAQALIRSLTQGSGQNSHIISQLLGQSQTTQTAQVVTQNRQKYAKSPLSVVNQSSGQVMGSPTNSQNITPLSPQHVQICASLNNLQSNLNPSQSSNTVTNISTHSCLSSSQTLNAQISMNVNAQNTSTAPMNIQTSNQGLQAPPSNNVQVTTDLSSKAPCLKFNIQSPRYSSSSQSNTNQQASNVQAQKSNQARLPSSCLNTNLQQNMTKYIQQNTQTLQKTLQSNSTAQRNAHLAKNVQNLQQMSLQQDSQCLQQNTQLHQQSLHQQMSSQTVQTQSVQHIFEQNSQQQQNTSSGMQHNAGNMLQQNLSNNMQHGTSNIMQQSTDAMQQHAINVMQQNTTSNVQNMEQSIQHGINDLHHVQQNITSSMQQQSTSTGLQNVNVQQNVNLQQQKIVISNATCSVNAQQSEPESMGDAHQNVNPHQNVQQQNILISNASCTANAQQGESQKSQSANSSMLNSAATSILNNAPKITPEILNALSNLNPNDQLLIANANGQMQVISQQLLQQFLAGQLNTAQQSPNQTQKIVIGEPDASSQNLQGVQINTPTSQIIVNSSGGAPTIQNNIQNIVVQAAPSQMPHQIQIQNSGFPSQFIDNLNQQQIRNLGNSQQSSPNFTPKKAKVAKKVKVPVTLAHSIGNLQATKTVTVSRPTLATTTATTTTISSQKCDNTNKAVNFIPQSTNPNKSESAQGIANGPSPGGSISMPSNGQVVQRVQTIQLPAQKQQVLKNIQAQIQTILARKPNTQPEQTILTKLYQEQARILASGKVISSMSHPVNSGAEATVSVNVVSTIVPSSQAQNICKNQTSTAQTQTQTSASVVTINSQNPNSSMPVSMQNLQSNTNNSTYMSNFTVQQNMQAQSMPNISSQNLHPTHGKQHKLYQNHGNQMLSSASTNVQTFPSANGSAASLPAQHLSQIQAQQTGTQQSTQCQTDPLDVKSSKQTPSPVKQEMPSPIQIQVQTGSPSGQVTVVSPRMAGKGAQRIQSPVNVSGSSAKQLVSPGSIASPLVSPRQGVKRPAPSPVCRQINRSDLLEQQLKIDQNGATNPDVNTPFTSKRDACKRLVRYHCFNEQVLSSKDLAKADEIFEETAKHLLSKFNSMMNKYTYLLLMESMREVKTSELMMIDRAFVAEEQSILSRLREQEAKVNEELKDEKPLVPKIEPDLTEDTKPASTVANVSVKRELEDDFPSMDVDSKPTFKSASCTSGDYDEWLEIQKELGVYPAVDSSKCKNSNGGGGVSGVCSGVIPKLSRAERTRANGEYRAGTANTVSKDTCEQGSGPIAERRWSSATDLERDLLEDTDSLDGLALHSQAQCPISLHLSNENDNENDDITAQVQSAIDSILNLKQGPTNALSSSGGSSASQSIESKDAVLDQAVRSILGS